MKVYHQIARNLNDSDQNIEFLFGENYNFHQIENAHLKNGMKKGKDVANAADIVLKDGVVVILGKFSFAYCLRKCRLLTTRGSDIQHNKDSDPVSTFMRARTIRDGFFLSRFDKLNETQAEINNTSLEHLLKINHHVAANQGKNKDNYH